MTPKFKNHVPVRPGSSMDRRPARSGLLCLSDNYLADTDHGIEAKLKEKGLIVDVRGDVFRAIRQAEVGAARTMRPPVEERFGLKPKRLAGDSAYGAAPMLAWLVKDRGIAPHIPVFDKSKRDDGTFSRADFQWQEDNNVYVCPAGKTLKSSGRLNSDNTYRYLASTYDCGPCPLKKRCCPKTPQRKIPRDINEDARDVARALYDTPAFNCSRVATGQQE